MISHYSFRRRAAIALAVAGCSAAFTHAALIDSSWNVVGNGNWGTSGNWSPIGIPNNNATNSYRVTNNSGFQINVTNISPTLDSLTIGSTSAISSSNGVLTILDQLTLNGRLFAGTDLVLGRAGTPITLSGSGTIELGSFANLIANGPLTIPGTTRIISPSGPSVIGAAPYALVNGANIEGSASGTISLVGSHILNSGDITSRRILVNSDATFTNSGDLIGVGSGITSITSAGTFVNSAAITRDSNSTLTINAPHIVNTGLISASGTFTFAQAPVSFINSGTVMLSRAITLGAFDNSGAMVLSGNVTVGTFTNTNGTISLTNSRLTTSAPMKTSELGRIDGTGTLSIGSLDNTGSELYALVNTTINGSITGGTLSTAAGRTIYVAGSNVVLDDVAINGTLSLNTTATVPTGQTLRGTGTITAGTIKSQSGALTIGDGLTIRGGSIGVAAAPLENFGTITNAWIAGTPIKNSGVIAVSGSTNTRFFGTFSRDELGTLVASNNGRFMISGTLLNEGQTLNATAAEPWTLGGTIQGGTLNIAAGEVVYTPYTYPATLTDVWINGKMIYDGELTPMRFTDGVIKGNADITLIQASLDGFNRITSGSGSLVISESVLIHGGGGFLPFTQSASGIGWASNLVPVVNHGTIHADFPTSSGWTGEFDIVATSTTNHGTLAVESGSTMRIFGGLTNSGRMSAKPGSLFLVDRPLTNTGTIDMSGAMIIDHNGASPIASLTSQLRQGYNDGAWDGPLISSSFAAVLAGTGVGIIEGADYIAATGTTNFGGQPIDATSVLMKYTYYGDTDLNGVINFDDYARVDGGFNNNRTGWFNGDFNYDQAINFDDYALIDLAFNTQTGPLQGMPNVQAVPEPASFAAWSIVLLCTLVRRRTTCAAIESD